MLLWWSLHCCLSSGSASWCRGANRAGKWYINMKYFKSFSHYRCWKRFRTSTMLILTIPWLSSSCAPASSSSSPLNKQFFRSRSLGSRVRRRVNLCCQVESTLVISPTTTIIIITIIMTTSILSSVECLPRFIINMMVMVTITPTCLTPCSSTPRSEASCCCWRSHSTQYLKVKLVQKIQWLLLLLENIFKVLQVHVPFIQKYFLSKSCM